MLRHSAYSFSPTVLEKPKNTSCIIEYCVITLLTVSGRVDRASATETVDSGSIPKGPNTVSWLKHKLGEERCQHYN